MRYLLDTNICIELLRGNRQVAEAINAAGFRNCCISEITKAELLLGYYKLKRKGKKVDERIFDFFAAIPSIAISSAIDLYAFELARLQSLGIVIEDFDLLIGCTSVAMRMTMVTDNVSHLSRIEGIRIENWMSR